MVLILGNNIAFDNHFGAYGARESWTSSLDQLPDRGITFETNSSYQKETARLAKTSKKEKSLRYSS